MVDIDGTYMITLGYKKGQMDLPLIISSKEDDLYAACSPNHPWFSSLTFEKGVPLEHDAHGAEQTLAGYVRLGTRVAFIPKSRNQKPPWHAREFIHSCDDHDLYVPQPAYSSRADQILQSLLSDAVKMVLFDAYCNQRYAYCGVRYTDVYVDDPLGLPITKREIDRINLRWNSRGLVRKLVQTP